MGGRISGVRTRVRTRRVELSTVPAAGASPSLTVPGGHVWRVRALYGSLVASAAVANRVPTLTVTVDGATVYVSTPPTAQTASSTVRYGWIPSDAESLGTDPRRLVIPELVLGPGATLVISTAAIDVADQWSALAAWIDDEWIKSGPIDLARMDTEIVGVIEPSA